MITHIQECIMKYAIELGAPPKILKIHRSAFDELKSELENEGFLVNKAFDPENIKYFMGVEVEVFE